MTPTAKLIRNYITDIRPHVTVVTIENYEQRLDRFVQWLGDRTPTRDAVKDWINHLLSVDKLTGCTVTLYRNTLRQFYRWAEEEGHVKQNPVSLRQKIAKEESDRTPIFKEEYDKLLAVAEGYWIYGTQCGWETGLRLTDVATLKWESVKLDAAEIHVTPSKTKRFNKKLEIPLSPRMVACLSELKLRHTEGDYVEQDMAETHIRNRLQLSSQFCALARKAGVKKSFHNFRHGLVTRLVERNVQPLVICSITGHSLTEVQRYSHPSMETKRKAIND